MSEKKNTVADLAEIATNILVEEIKRRARATTMTVEELLTAADVNWNKAEAEADALLSLGHQ